MSCIYKALFAVSGCEKRFKDCCYSSLMQLIVTTVPTMQ